MTGGLVAVHAHPDDETLSTGALLATWAAAGRPTTVVTCTRGERGEVIPDDLAHLEGDGPALAAHRESELVAALDALGVTGHYYLDTLPGMARVVDSGMAWVAAGQAGPGGDPPPGAFVSVPVDRAASALAEVLRETRPAVVVGYEPGGGYGHPDHVHAHRVMMRAVELAASGPGRSARPVVLWAAQPEEQLRRAYVSLATGAVPGTTLPDPDGPVPSAVVPDAQVDLRVDVAPVLDRVLQAMRAHGTQVHHVSEVAEGPPALGAPRTRAGSGADVLARFALSNDVLQPLLGDECYRVAPGSGPAPAWPAGVRPTVP